MMGFANFAIESFSFLASAPLIRSNNVWPWKIQVVSEISETGPYTQL